MELDHVADQYELARLEKMVFQQKLMASWMDTGL